MRYCRSGVVYWAHLKPYISANMFANRPSKQAYLYPIRWNVSGETVSIRLTGCFFAPGYKALGRACEHGAWKHSAFFCMFSGMLDFAAKSCGIGSLFQGFSFFRTFRFRFVPFLYLPLLFPLFAARSFAGFSWHFVCDIVNIQNNRGEKQ